jgi:hypothetical protein
MRPPASKKAAMTAAHSSRSSGSSPTLKVIQVPSPTIGISSRVEGIGGARAGSAGHAGGLAGARADRRQGGSHERSACRPHPMLHISGGQTPPHAVLNLTQLNVASCTSVPSNLRDRPADDDVVVDEMPVWYPQCRACGRHPDVLTARASGVSRQRSLMRCIHSREFLAKVATDPVPESFYFDAGAGVDWLSSFIPRDTESRQVSCAGRPGLPSRARPSADFQENRHSKPPRMTWRAQSPPVHADPSIGASR